MIRSIWSTGSNVSLPSIQEPSSPSPISFPRSDASSFQVPPSLNRRLAKRRSRGCRDWLGRKGWWGSRGAELAIADALPPAIQETGIPARVAFDDPDAIVLIETVGA